MENTNHRDMAGDGPPEAATPGEAPQALAEVPQTVPEPGLIRVPARHNPLLVQILARINADRELQALWRAANVNAVDRLGMADHGRVHVQIVANVALRLLRMMIEAGVQPSIVSHHNLTNEDAEVVVFLASIFHDIGIAIHRDEHEQLSVVLAAPRLREILSDFYDSETATIVQSEILHAILAHNRNVKALTIEAGAMRVADALDMTKGRTRIPFESGHVNIHSLSAAAIEKVQIGKGEGKPILIRIEMSNSSGLYQVDELLRNKLLNSGIEEYIEVEAAVTGETEKRLLPTFRL